MMNSRLCIVYHTVRLRLLCVCLYVLSATIRVECFNVDPDLARVISGPSGSYFGFSVRILAYDSKHTRVIVGAPLANSTLDTHLRKPGAVFDCDFDGLTECPPLDFGVDDGGKPHEFHEQLMGFSLDVAPGKPNRITACAPLWKNARLKDSYLAQGQCYEIGYNIKKTPSFSVQYSPLIPAKNKYDRLFVGGLYMKGMGESGFSVHYTKVRDGRADLVAGAPGYFEWRGGIVYIDNTTSSIYNPSVLSDEFKAESYNAYSLSSGVFFSDGLVYLVTGSPNYGYKGKVFVVHKDFGNIRLERSGEQFGSYFGASVCAVDVNNDSYDDLIVGAPLYSSVSEEGKVYVYLSDSLSNFHPSTSIPGPGVRYGRFGTAIEGMGDLNRDGYNDVVIGAPFVGGNGAIYIHQGNKLGLRTTPSQEILGKTIQPDLRGFGWAFSKSIDADNNQYPDFAVGATFSDHVITFRTRPVATVEISLDMTDDVVSADPRCRYEQRLVQCTVIRVSFKYTGVNCPSSLEIEYELRADTLADEEVELGRAQFQLEQDVVTPSIHRSLTLQHGRPVIVSFEVIIQSKRDYFTDLGFDFSYKHTSECRLEKALCPVYDKNYPTKLHKTVSFPKQCGSDGLCMSDLKMAAVMPDNLVIGSPTMTIKIVLDNHGEDAHLSKVELLFDSDMHISSVIPIDSQHDSPVYCIMDTPSVNRGNSSANCFTGNPLSANSSVQFLVSLDTSKLNPDKHSMTVYLKASSKSDELNSTLFDNFIAHSITLKGGSDVAVKGLSVPEQLSYRPQTSSSKDEKRILLTHRYTVSNIGIGTSPGLTIHVSVPLTDAKGKQLFDLTSFEIVPEDGQKSDINGECQYLAESSAKRSTSTQGREPSPTELIFTCENAHCTTVSCKLSGLKAGSGSLVKINGWIQEASFASFKAEGVIKFQSNATVTVDDHPLLNPDSFRSGHFYVTTDLHGHIISRASLWIVVVAVVIAVIILLLVCVILWKFGFFRRPKREDMKSLLQDEYSEHSEMRSLNSPDDETSTDPVVSPESVTSPGSGGALLELVPPVEPCVASGGADYIIPVSKTGISQKDEDEYLHCVYVGMPPEGRTENDYVDEDNMKAHRGTRL